MELPRVQTKINTWVFLHNNLLPLKVHRFRLMLIYVSFLDGIFFNLVVTNFATCTTHIRRANDEKQENYKRVSALDHLLAKTSQINSICNCIYITVCLCSRKFHLISTKVYDIFSKNFIPAFGIICMLLYRCVYCT